MDDLPKGSPQWEDAKAKRERLRQERSEPSDDLPPAA